MEYSTKILLMAAGVLVTCLILSVSFFMYREYSGAVSESAKSLNQEKLEYQNSDLLQYDGARMKGSEVLTAIRKYQRELRVTVETNRGTTEYPNENSSVLINDEGSVDWVNPNAYFDSSIERDVNGSISKITFKQEIKGSSSDVETVTTIDGAKQVIVSALNGEAETSMTWHQLASIINGNGTNLPAKRRLVSALGGGANESMSWIELASLTEDILADLRKKVEDSNKDFQDNTVHQLQRTLNSREAYNIGFVPRLVVVYKENTDTCTVYQSGVWTGENVCTLDGDRIINTSDYDITFYALEWK